MSIWYLLETSDHDGYCSGNECEYEAGEHSISIKREYLELGEPSFKEMDWSVRTSFDRMMASQLTEKQLNYLTTWIDGTVHLKAEHESGCCNDSPAARLKGLERHDFRVTITCVQPTFHA